MKLENSELREHVEMYADAAASNGKWKQTMFFLGKYIPEKKLKNAVASYARLSDGEVPLLLFDDAFFGSAKEGLMLTTSNLYYCALLKTGKAPEKVNGCIPLSDIQNVFFDFAKFQISDTTVSGTVLYINSKPFAYLLKVADCTVLNNLFSELNTMGHVDTASLQKPIWAFVGEEFIRDMSAHKIEYFSDAGAGGYAKTFITNARIVRILDTAIQAVRAQSHYSPELFFDAIELSDILDFGSPRGYDGKLVLELRGGGKATFIADPGAIKELTVYIRKALERMIPVISFEDPDEKILFKEQALSHYGSFSSDALWENVIGSTRIGARFCMTNKRLLYYRVDQISSLSGNGFSFRYNITPPCFKWIWLPLYGITGMMKEKKGLFHTMRLYINKCAPVGETSQSPVIPRIDRQNSTLQYDPAYDKAIRETTTLDFDHLISLSKRERREVSKILRDLLPDIEIPEI